MITHDSGLEFEILDADPRRDVEDEGALAGLVDANYMAKLRGLRDLKDVTSNCKEAGTKAMQVNVLSEDAVKNLQKLGGI